MALVRYRPWNLLSDTDFEDFFKTGLKPFDESIAESSHWLPDVDIEEQDDKFVVLADLPGIQAKDIDVSMKDNVLTIRGERVEEKEEKKKDYTRKERREGKFYRVFSLPNTADSEKIKAKIKDGVLEVVIPKRELKQSRQIQVED
ncbi:MAG: Hsp20/alpha crystallin family protein [Gammaproteobacteria bacterium]|nr:Hsp20/alpha crystallin family protein [Gammaproteobacteria bacterium]